ncbi:Manganese transport system membrane protein MntB [Meiothermus luteus]|uniref:Manganese transport system membrane protein MntB n=1 Tax=Meiothermus luteus TaxID=2026184 RepID=A0A399EZS1_9DEIN|nr:iron chelate uptake ABC transporter family permease subunit [Meiothermus luteus]RIH88032.1 Manganese transport system membrane protein MntB [Meiothermus luteus]RMH56843.1 MAG: metal ABC transporter permease [Deinococcota bacterium]
MELLSQLFIDYTLRNVALGSALLGLIGGVLGAFALLRQQSLLGDVLAHAALPGICLAFLLTGSKTPSLLLLGGGLAGWVAALGVLAVLRHTRLPQDAALGVALSSFFGLGIALLTFIQHNHQGNPAGLDRFIFGQAASLLGSDVLGFALLGGVVLALVGLFYKEFKLISFDPDYATSLGLPTRGLGILLTSLIVLAVMVGLQTVGVVLMAAMLIAPAAAARQWTNRLGRMVALSGLLGALAGVAGALLSASRENLPTGPLVVLSITAVVVFSLFFAPLRGLFWQGLRNQQNRRRTELERLLLDAHLLANHGRLNPEELALHRGEPLPKARRHLDFLKAQGWVEPKEGGFQFTEPGLQKALALKETLRLRS